MMNTMTCNRLVGKWLNRTNTKSNVASVGAVVGLVVELLLVVVAVVGVVQLQCPFSSPTVV